MENGVAKASVCAKLCVMSTKLKRFCEDNVSAGSGSGLSAIYALLEFLVDCDLFE